MKNKISVLFVAGKPQPMVRWLVNGRVKDEEYENNAGDVIENRYDNFFGNTLLQL